VLSAVLSIVSAILLFSARTNSNFDTFLLFLALFLLGGQHGIQLTAEEVYTYNCVDKGVRMATLGRLSLATHAGAFLAAALSYLVVNYAQPFSQQSIVEDQTEPGTLSQV